jgi:hypothetical protein
MTREWRAYVADEGLNDTRKEYRRIVIRLRSANEAIPSTYPDGVAIPLPSRK